MSNNSNSVNSLPFAGITKSMTPGGEQGSGQPYISWKINKNTTNSVVPVFSRPNSNLTNILPSIANGQTDSGAGEPGTPDNNGISSQLVTQNEYMSAFGTARPLKHWRKRLKPAYRTSNSNASMGVNQVIESPGGTTNLGAFSNDCIKCISNDNDSYIGHVKNYIVKTSKNHTPFTNQDPNFIIEWINPDLTFMDKTGSPLAYEENNGSPVCVQCNVANDSLKRVRPNSTILKKNYYSDTKNYLRSRVKRYNQNQLLSPKSGQDYFSSTGKLLYPTDDENGSQNFNSTNCREVACEGTGTGNLILPKSQQLVIYKPNNIKFCQESAASSSLYLTDLKYNTINNNASSFYQDWGTNGANAATYKTSLSDHTNTYFLKSRLVSKSDCCDLGGYPFMNRRYGWWMSGGGGRQPSGGAGHHTINFNTNSSEVEPGMRSTPQNNMIGTGTGKYIPEQKIFNWFNLNSK